LASSFFVNIVICFVCPSRRVAPRKTFQIALVQNSRE
jgi:hypothetical protein